MFPNRVSAPWGQAFILGIFYFLSHVHLIGFCLMFFISLIVLPFVLSKTNYLMGVFFIFKLNCYFFSSGGMEKRTHSSRVLGWENRVGPATWSKLCSQKGMEHGILNLCSPPTPSPPSPLRKQSGVKCNYWGWKIHFGSHVRNDFHSSSYKTKLKIIRQIKECSN